MNHTTGIARDVTKHITIDYGDDGLGYATGWCQSTERQRDRYPKRFFTRPKQAMKLLQQLQDLRTVTVIISAEKWPDGFEQIPGIVEIRKLRGLEEVLVKLAPDVVLEEVKANLRKELGPATYFDHWRLRMASKEA